MVKPLKTLDNELSLDSFVPSRLRMTRLRQAGFPALAKNQDLCAEIEEQVKGVPTTQTLMMGDARGLLSTIPSESVHLVLTSPPYWVLKQYPEREGQLGSVEDYDAFVSGLATVWRECHRVLVCGGRLVIVVGDVSLKRRAYGRHITFPLHASIQEGCRQIGFDNLTPIIWQKNANASYEVEGRGGFLGKPYEPNALIKNDIEFILLQRKPGKDGKRHYRAPSTAQRVLSIIPEALHHQWFQPIWTLRGESLRHHPAPFPVELATRLVRMFSFVGDIVLDPFCGTGTTLIAAGTWGRHGIGIEVEPQFFQAARFRIGMHLPYATLTPTEE